MKKIIALIITMCMLCALLAPTTSAADTESGLVAHLTFDDAADPGKDEVGTYTPEVLGEFEATEGMVGGALVFDGSTTGINYVDTGLNFTSWTVSMWIKLNENPSTSSMEVCAGFAWPGDSNVIHLAIETSGIVSFDGSMLWSQFLVGNKTSDTLTVDDSWTLLTYTCDGEEGIFKIYFNGVEKFEGLFNGTLDGGFDYGADYNSFTVGGWMNGGTNLDRVVNGAIDDFRLYDRALSEEDVIALAGDKYVAPETDPETDAPETNAPETKAPETNATETQAPTDAQTTAGSGDDSSSGGCGSVMGASALAVALVSVLGCAVIKKR